MRALRALALAALALGLAAPASRAVAAPPTSARAAAPAPASTALRPARVQDDAPEAPRDDAAELEDLLTHARDGSTVVRPQAARRLLSFGDAAAERLVRAIAEDPRGLAGLGAELTVVLGELDDARLRAALWEGIADPDFPWRPSAALALAHAPRADEAPRFRELLRDPLGAVRLGAVDAVARLALEDEAQLLGACLDDPDDRVRRQAAERLDDLGERWALAWLVEDLARDDAYFELRTGQVARFAAARALTERLGDLAGYQVRRPPSDAANREALATLRARVRELAGRDRIDLPVVARASARTEGDVVGLELRSCRRGEHFLRWNVDDVLYVGTGNAARIELPPGTVARLRERTAAAFAALDGTRLFGEVGCDLEQFHFRADPAQRATTVRISKGPDAIDGLRPDALSALAAALVATLPDEPVEHDPRVDRLRTRVTAALAALGGPLERTE